MVAATNSEYPDDLIVNQLNVEMYAMVATGDDGAALETLLDEQMCK